jgi:hypothetical protein
VKVGGGKVVRATMEEVLGMAEKAGGADERFREAAEVRKAFGGMDAQMARKGVRVMELVERFQGEGEPSEAEVEEFVELIGMDPADLGPGKKGRGQGKEGRKEGGRKEAAPVGMNDLDGRVRVVVEEAEKAAMERLEREIGEKVKNALDKDKEIGKVVEMYPEGPERDLFRERVLYEIGIDDALSRVARGQPLDSTALQTIVQKARSRVQSIGVRRNPDRVPVSPPEGTGLGTFGKAVFAEEPIRRALPNEDGDENAAARLAQIILRTSRGGGRGRGQVR